MKIVITGANSFIGKRLSDKTVSFGWETVLVMRPGRMDAPLPGTSVVPFCMEDYAGLGAAVGGCDCFIHLAWMGTRGAARMDRAMQQRNFELSVQAVESMLSAGCGQIITAGSQAEYGICNGLITEESACHPNTEYGKAKLSLYEFVEKKCSQAGRAYKEPRFFSLYGEGDSEKTMIIKVLKDMLANYPCELTECIQIWDFLHITDAVEGLFRLCSMPCPDGVYNFGSGDIRPLKAYIAEMAEITGTKSELRFGAVPYPETGMVSIQPDVSKLKRELQWEPQISFEEGIRRILRAMKQEVSHEFAG